MSTDGDRPMISTLTPLGDELALVIDRALLERLNIGAETPLEVTTDGLGLVVRPVGAGHRARVLELAERVMAVHEETLRRLAL